MKKRKTTSSTSPATTPIMATKRQFFTFDEIALGTLGFDSGTLSGSSLISFHRLSASPVGSKKQLESDNDPRYPYRGTNVFAEKDEKFFSGRICYGSPAFDI